MAPGWKPDNGVSSSRGKNGINLIYPWGELSEEQKHRPRSVDVGFFVRRRERFSEVSI